jgi:DNA-binding transcriptional MerR regulator
VTDVTQTKPELTIDELARRTGMTVRNIRAHQSRGLLAPPEVRGRTGYYGPEHEARIELIRELQAEGFNLEAIKRMLDPGGGSIEEVVRFTRAAKVPFEDEEPEIVDLAALVERWGRGGDPALLQRAIEAGMIRPLGDGRFEIPLPRLARASLELRAVGFPPGRGLDVAEAARVHADGIAQLFVELFDEEIWKPFEEAGSPEERWPEVREALERLRPLATESVIALFQRAMTEATERAMGRRIERVNADDEAADD